MRISQLFSFLAVLGMAFVEAKGSGGKYHLHSLFTMAKSSLEYCSDYKDCVNNCDSGNFGVNNPNGYPEFDCV
jgi:hypothetical protein